MLFMDEATLIAHALRDFLRSQLSSSDLLVMDFPLQAGEALSALDSGLSLAAVHAIALPPIFGEKILAISGLSAQDVEMFSQDLSRIPRWFQLAS
jgi:hypothetical protein